MKAATPPKDASEIAAPTINVSRNTLTASRVSNSFGPTGQIQTAGFPVGRTT